MRLHRRQNDLIYVSPKTGRAVSRDAAGIYASRLFKLPQFLLDKAAEPAPAISPPAWR